MEAAEESEARERLLDWLGVLVGAVDQAFIAGRGQASAFELAEVERANVRAAMRWAADNGRESRALHLASAKQYWGFRGLGAEERAWLVDLLGRPVEYESRERAHALSTLGSLEMRAGDLEAAVERFRAAEDLWQQLGERRRVGVIENSLNIIAERRDDFEGARAHLERALVVFRELDDRVGIASIVGNLGILAMRRDDLDAAEAHFESTVGVARELGDEGIEATGLFNLAAIAVRRIDRARSAGLLERAIDLCLRLDDVEGTIGCIELAGQLALLGSRPSDAVRLVTGAERWRLESGFARTPPEVPEYRAVVDAARDSLGEAAYVEARAEGNRLSAAVLVELARDQVRMEKAPA